MLNTGWGIRDTHAVPSNLQYGPDNYIWGVVGYSGFNGEMNGKPLQFTQGPYRFKPDGSEFEYLTGRRRTTRGASASRNVRRVRIDSEQRSRAGTWRFPTAISRIRGAAGRPGAARRRAGLPELGGVLRRASTTPYIRQVDVWGGYTAAAGHHLYTARAFPKEYWNRVAFISEPTAHIDRPGASSRGRAPGSWRATAGT